MSTNIRKTEDNYFRRAQLEAMIREEFADLKVYESEDGTEEWFIPNPQAYPDDLVDKMKPLTDQRDIAEVLVDWASGKGSWARFKKAGGQSMFVMFAIKREQDRLTGEKPGEGTPTD